MLSNEGVHVSSPAYFCGCAGCMGGAAEPASFASADPESFATNGGKWGASGTLGTNGGVVTWSLAGAGLANQTGSAFFSGSTVSLSNFLNFDFQAVLRQAFDAWSSVANIEFIQTTDGGGNVGTGAFANIRIVGGFIDGASNVLARAFLPNTGGTNSQGATNGDVVFDSGETTFWTAHSFFLTAVHEIGHSLGLNHEEINLAIMNPSINLALSGLQTDDINGIQSVYGAQDFGPNIYTMPSTLANLVLIDGAPSLSIVGNGLGNVIVGTDSPESIDGGAGANSLYGRGGNDYVTATGNLNQAFGDDGTDQLYFNGNQNQLFGGEGHDWLGVNGTNNALAGGNGNEVWMGASGNSNTLNGEGGSDSLFANGTGNFLHGGADTDWLGVSGTSNALYGAAGNEWMGATGNSNYLLGGDQGDTLLSIGGNFLYGETGDDWVGCSGNGNLLNGAQGNDYLAASGNNNTLDGGAGNDQLVCGGAHAGNRFVFHAGYGIDTIVNFSRHDAGGTDVIDLNGFGLDFNTLQPHLSFQAGGVAVITIDAATTLTIANGVPPDGFLASDFIF